MIVFREFRDYNAYALREAYGARCRRKAGKPTLRFYVELTFNCNRYVLFQIRLIARLERRGTLKLAILEDLGTPTLGVPTILLKCAILNSRIPAFVPFFPSLFHLKSFVAHVLS